MKSSKQIVAMLLASTMVTAAPVGQRKRVANPPNAQQRAPSAVLALNVKMRRFAPTVLTANTSQLSLSDRRALRTIIAAARYFDPLYRRQVWSGNEAMLKQLALRKDPVWAHYFRINAGPWSQLDSNEAFIEGVPARPAYANFYPNDITKEEFNAWLNSLSPAEKEKATGYFYTVRRDAGGKLKTVPYSEEYREFLDP
ncbi:MAG TPA: hypothetical protein VLQ90_15710, partial [Pyrinomonadaceae bacterium]|nr:hypothetical protein [Pyrinomonadaceae bacterium]